MTRVDRRPRVPAVLQRLHRSVVTAITPTDLSPASQSICAHYPFVEETIDFEKLKNFKGKFFMNSYCIENGEIAAIRQRPGSKSAPNISSRRYRIHLSMRPHGSGATITTRAPRTIR